MQFSYWENRTYFDDVDVVVIGSGIVGLSSAIELKNLDSQLRILVIERGMIPFGASTKNAGFACFGSVTELLDDLETSSQSDVLALVEKRFNGLATLRQLLSDSKIGYEGLGGYELLNDDNALKSIGELNRLLQPITQIKETYIEATPKIKEFKFKNTNHLILNQAEGQIDTGLMMSSLISLAISKSIHILNQIHVTSFTENENGILLNTQLQLKIRAKKLLICTNGFAKQLLPDLNVEPARAQVLITQPIHNLPFKGAFHYEKGYYYFRNIDNRVLFGGGRNLDFESEHTPEFGLTNKIQNQLDFLLKTVILPTTSFSVDYRWSGIMGVGEKKSPIIKQLTTHTFCAVRMGGMGIAIGTLVGQEAANLVFSNL